MNKVKLHTIFLFLLFFSGNTSARVPNVIPAPVRMTVTEGGYSITPTTVIVAVDSVSLPLADYLNEYLSPMVGTPLSITVQPQAANAIVLAVNPRADLPAEGYRLSATRRGVYLTGKDRGGLFNGIQTLLQLLPETVYTRRTASPHPRIGCVEIEDYPRFSYRGMMLDVARTFIPIDRVKLYIDWLSHHKINKFHWHLADDEGWRVEIESYPQLARTAGFRGGDSPVKAIYGEWTRKYGGYYTQEEIREVVEFARFRNVEIIPEIDLPGHSRAVARVFPEILCRGPVDSTAAGYDRRNVWCASRESNYRIYGD